MREIESLGWFFELPAIPKKQGFGPKINCSQMKLRNFVNPSADSMSKIGPNFRK